MGKLEQTVRSIYGAMEDPEMKDFSKLEAFLRPLFADDCEWEKFPTRNYAQEAGVPWVARRSGVDKALEHFKDLQQALAISRFHVVRMAEVEDRTLLVWLDFEGTNLRTGKVLEDFFLLEWSFNEEGKITGFRHCYPTWELQK